MAAPAGPKFELKMLAMPAMLLLSRKIDFKDENIVRMFQMGLVAVTVVILSLHFFVYSQVNGKKDSKKIWVPPKPKPSLPFGLGPAPEPIKIEEFSETTYNELEIKLLKESAQSVLMSVGIAFFMSIQFKIHMSLAMQCVMVPLSTMDSLVLKKYLLGTKTGPDGSSHIYGELEAAPTAEDVARLNAAAAPANDSGNEKKEDGEAAAAVAGKECRVEELKEDDEEPPALEKVKESKGKKPTTPASELD